MRLLKVFYKNQNEQQFSIFPGHLQITQIILLHNYSITKRSPRIFHLRRQLPRNQRNQTDIHLHSGVAQDAGLHAGGPVPQVTGNRKPVLTTCPAVPPN